jgi:hypothetical protein
MSGRAAGPAGAATQAGGVFEAAARAYAVRSRTAQGLPARVRDPVAVARVVAMLTAGA